MNQFHYVNVGVSDLHQKPSRTSEVVNQATYGTPIQLLNSQGSWVHVSLPDSYSGWMLGSEIFTRNKPYPYHRSAIVTTLWTYLYHSPDTSPRPPILAIPYPAKIEIVATEETNRWMKVSLLDGREAFAQKRDFCFDDKKLSKEELIQESMKFLGLPYRWGGKSGFGFDCSGLIQTLFSRTGIELPRDSKDQAQSPVLKPIEQKELQPTDILFFKGTTESVTHVGLYIGKDRFIHAVTTNETGPHVTQISNLKDEEWQKRYLFAKRAPL